MIANTNIERNYCIYGLNTVRVLLGLMDYKYSSSCTVNQKVCTAHQIECDALVPILTPKIAWGSRSMNVLYTPL